jgi:hypothetical protein
MKFDSWVSFLACTFASPCLDHEPKARVATLWWFFIFDKFVLKEYIFQVDKSPHLFQSRLCGVRNDFPLTIKKTHPFFESLTIIDTTSL